MRKCTFYSRLRGLSVLLVTGMVLVGIGVRAQEKGKTASRQLPKQVLEGLHAKFPGAEVQKWTKEKGKDVVLYDIEFKQEGLHCEADVREDGTINNWEKAIPAKDLPAAVVTAVEKRYPKAVVKEVMQTTVVKDGREELEGYEINLHTADKKKVEMTVAPDGKILEDSGAKK